MTRDASRNPHWAAGGGRQEEGRGYALLCFPPWRPMPRAVGSL
jgi:hypothetical protein